MREQSLKGSCLVMKDSGHMVTKQSDQDKTAQQRSRIRQVRTDRLLQKAWTTVRIRRAAQVILI